MAQRIAARLKGTSGDAPPVAAGQRPAEPSATNGTARAQSNGRPDPAQGPSDLQQALTRVPTASLSDLNKGDAVMIVAAPGTQEGGVTAITLLAGVEPILEASPKNGQSILSPWSLSSGGGEAAAP
jgi:hypothetical protein